MMKFTERENSRFIEVLDMLNEDCFFDHLTGSYDFWGWTEEVHDYEDDDIFFHAGATKVAIEINDIGWVLKVDFDNVSMPYCELEANNYAEAEREGFADLFAAEYFLCEREGRKIYVQEQAIPDEDAVSSTCYEYYTSDMTEEEAEDWWNYGGPDNLEDDQRIAALLGQDMSQAHFNEFLAFIDRLEINDLHTGNFGYRKDGAVVIFDYSGFQG